MTEPQIIASVSAVSLIAYVTLIVAIGLRQGHRIMRHRLFGEESPDLLIRDAVFFWSLAALVGLPTIAGAFGITLGEHLWWVITRTLIGVSVLTFWAYYEFIVIGRNHDE